MARGYSTKTTCVHLMNYHYVWCSKYRKRVLINGVRERLKQLIHTKADEMKCKVLELKVMPDHVHLLIETNPTLTPNRVIGQIKDHTSRILRQEFPSLRRRIPSLWTRSYFVSTAGNVGSGVIKKYIEEQTGI